jgi:hypothetical protein
LKGHERPRAISRAVIGKPFRDDTLELHSQSLQLIVPVPLKVRLASRGRAFSISHASSIRHHRFVAIPVSLPCFGIE